MALSQSHEQTDASGKNALTGPVLVIGVGGMLYRAWTTILDRDQIEHHDPGLDQLDFTQPQTIDQVVTDQYRMVLNCAAYTDVDGAESDESLATQINGHGVGYLAKRCQQINALLVHYSTDYVFNGRADKPYPVDTPRDPISAYGRSKALGEQLIEQSGCPYLIVRTSWLYAPWGNNFVRTMVRLMGDKQSLKVVDDQYGRPTSAQHLADTTYRLMQAGHRGIWHVTDGGQCSWYEFACEIARIIKATCQVEPCTTAAFERPAPRPAYSVLDIEPTEQCIGPMPNWKENLASVLSRLE